VLGGVGKGCDCGNGFGDFGSVGGEAMATKMSMPCTMSHVTKRGNKMPTSCRKSKF
jgi:hypothetical protein